MKVEIQLEDGRTEICEVIRRFNDGDYLLDRKKRRRMELVSNFCEEYLHHKHYSGNYIFVDVYLKDTKGNEQARVRRLED